MDHDIHAHWHVLSDANLGDEELRRHIAALAPFVKSLARIDDDGQQLRYHQNRDEEQSLATYSLANLEVIRSSLVELSGLIEALKYRIIDYIDERRTGAYTSKLSRSDLMCIAKMMPPLTQWTESVFDERKEAVKRFGLSSNDFSDAINVIKRNREMKAQVRGTTGLIYFPDELLVWVAQQWRKRHPPRYASHEPTVVRLGKETLEAMEKHARISREVIKALEIRLTTQQIAELEAMFYLGRSGWFPEFYEEEVARTIDAHALDKEFRVHINHIMAKTDFQEAIAAALTRLGRPSLAERISQL